MTHLQPTWVFWIPLIALALAAANFFLNSRYDRLAWLWPPAWIQRQPDVVVGVVTRNQQVLLVHRRPAKKSRLHWQFPSGQVGAETDLKQRVVREVAQETGVVVQVVQEIGRRRHPLTGRLCAYFSATYISGETENLEPHENIYVAWVPINEVEAYLTDNLFSKVKKSLSLS